MSEFKDDTFLSRWINNELSDEELAEFKKSKDYAMYNRIVSGSELIESANFDEDALLSRIKHEQYRTIGQPKRKWWVYSAAASIVGLIALLSYLFLFTEELTSYETQIGQKLNVALPDGSTVVLNANSLLTFSPDTWSEKRQLSLKGEGYFKVKKGSSFIVETANGNVTVLGTQFTVKELDDFFEVMCFEGSVRVTTSDDQEILKPKTSVRKTRKSQLMRRNILISKPSWIANKSSFTSVPINYVLLELKNQYGVSFEGKDLLGNVTFNGTFPHNDLNLALKIVLDPTNVNYERKGNVVVLSKN